MNDKPKSAEKAQISEEHGVTLGYTLSDDVLKKVILEPEDRLRHMLLVGKGEDLSILLSDIILQDIEFHQGVCILDPYGDLIDRIQKNIPPARVDDVVLIDLTRVKQDLVFNPLDVQTAYEQRIVTSWLVESLRRLMDPEKQGHIDALIEYILRQIVLSTIELRGTLSDVSLFLTDLANANADPINKRISALRNQDLSDFWQRELLIAGDPSDEQWQKNKTMLLKIAEFLRHPQIMKFTDPSSPSIHFTDLMDQKKIILLKLGKNLMPENVHDFIASIFIAQFWVASLRRYQLPLKSQPKCFLYLTKLQILDTMTFIQMLSEGRRVNIALTLSLESVSLIKSENLRDALLANIGNLITFQVHQSEAELLVHEYAPAYTKESLTKIPPFHAIVKMIKQGKIIKPFLLAIDQPSS
jgi:hypothetical protein